MKIKQNTPTPDRRQLRNFGFTTGVIVVVLFGIALPWVYARDWPTWPWVVAACLIGPGLLMPRVLLPIYHLWMRFGHVMGVINSRILLGLVFYVIITPLGLLLRLFGWDPLHCRLGEEKSYRIISHSKNPNHFERPF